MSVHSNLAYIGSKYSALDAIEQVLLQHVSAEELAGLTVLDMFSGTGVVGAHLNRRFKCSVVANDTEKFAACIARALLTCPYTPDLERHVAQMNVAAQESGACDGPMVREFADERKFFTRENAKRIQAARDYVDTCGCEEPERSFLLASLIASSDRVANTAAVYASYLKDYKKAALKPMVVAPIHADLQISNKDENGVCCGDATALLDAVGARAAPATTLAFVDPPYVARQYSSYYSPLGIIHSNTTDGVHGAGALMPNAYLSDFAAKKRAAVAFKQLVARLADAGVQYVFVTYGAYGIIPDKVMGELLKERYGRVQQYDICNRKFKSEASQDSKDVTEKWYFCTGPADARNAGQQEQGCRGVVDGARDGLAL